LDASVPRVKTFVLLIVIGVLGYLVYQKNVIRKHELLVGTWGMERDVRGIACKAIMNLKSDGDGSVEYDGKYQERIISKDALGTWESDSNTFRFTFTRGEIPQLVNGKHYGGRFLILDDKTLSYKTSENVVETWRRLR
jgi:hypothetical protein